MYDYECFIRDTDVDIFIREIILSLEGNYNEIYGSEELNLIDTEEWQEFLDENGIEYDPDEWFPFPYEAVWNCIHEKLLNMLNAAYSNIQKFETLKEELENYSWLLECADFSNGEYQFEIIIFDNHKDFAGYFFDYLMESLNYIDHFKPFRKRIEEIRYLIDEHDFPKSEFQVGVLYEWLNLYELIVRRVLL